MSFVELIEGIGRISHLLPDNQGDNEGLIYKIETVLQMINKNIFDEKYHVEYKKIVASDEDSYWLLKSEFWI